MLVLRRANRAVQRGRLASDRPCGCSRKRASRSTNQLEDRLPQRLSDAMRWPTAPRELEVPGARLAHDNLGAPPPTTFDTCVPVPINDPEPPNADRRRLRAAALRAGRLWPTRASAVRGLSAPPRRPSQKPRRKAKQHDRRARLPNPNRSHPELVGLAATRYRRKPSRRSTTAPLHERVLDALLLSETHQLIKMVRGSGEEGRLLTTPTSGLRFLAIALAHTISKTRRRIPFAAALGRTIDGRPPNGEESVNVLACRHAFWRAVAHC